MTSKLELVWAWYDSCVDSFVAALNAFLRLNCVRFYSLAVCLSVKRLHTQLRCAKTAAWIKVLFGVKTLEIPRNIMEVPISHGPTAREISMRPSPNYFGHLSTNTGEDDKKSAIRVMYDDRRQWEKKFLKLLRPSDHGGIFLKSGACTAFRHRWNNSITNEHNVIWSAKVCGRYGKSYTQKPLSFTLSDKDKLSEVKKFNFLYDFVTLWAWVNHVTTSIILHRPAASHTQCWR